MGGRELDHNRKQLRKRADDDAREMQMCNLAGALGRVRVKAADLSYDDLSDLAINLALDFDSGGGDVFKGKLQLDAIRLAVDIKKEKDRPTREGDDEDDFERWKTTTKREA